MNHRNIHQKWNIRWLLVFYDLGIYLLSCLMLLVLYHGGDVLLLSDILTHTLIGLITVFASRFIGKVYRQVWRYGGIQSYIRLLITDAIGCIAFFAIQRLPCFHSISAVRLFSLCCVNLLLALAIRMIYRYAYKCGKQDTLLGRLLFFLIRTFGRTKLSRGDSTDTRRIKIAIVGAGRVGTGLAEELINNPTAAYLPRLFIDISADKVGRQIVGLPIIDSEAVSADLLHDFEIQEIVFAIPRLDVEQTRALYDRYRAYGVKIKVYDYPTMHVAGEGKRHMREFDIEELLFRQPLKVIDGDTDAYYRGKRVLITGGGGSIGAELCRQIAAMAPARLIILDVYENGAYDIQQELRIAYGDALDVRVEILSVTNAQALDRVFAEHAPQIVLHAAAHKHVPLMEKNCVEAVENNVFGTLTCVKTCEKHHVERFHMVSTDKAVNPTNVMGATKRMCEMIIGAYSTLQTGVKYSATRFGNVLGSAGSVIPLFKRQIAQGGPITITDKRIIRYFMTIPEASQLVLYSGAQAGNGAMYVLNMGKPIRILDLAENMIRLSGLEPYRDIDIVETGLRPGEKLWEEILVRPDVLRKTGNALVFLDSEQPISPDELENKLSLLKIACQSGSDSAVKATLMEVIPTYHDPSETNRAATRAREMKEAEIAVV